MNLDTVVDYTLHGLAIICVIASVVACWLVLVGVIG